MRRTLPLPMPLVGFRPSVPESAGGDALDCGCWDALARLWLWLWPLWLLMRSSSAGTNAASGLGDGRTDALAVEPRRSGGICALLVALAQAATAGVRVFGRWTQAVPVRAGESARLWWLLAQQQGGVGFTLPRVTCITQGHYSTPLFRLRCRSASINSSAACLAAAAQKFDCVTGYACGPREAPSPSARSQLLHKVLHIYTERGHMSSARVQTPSRARARSTSPNSSTGFRLSPRRQFLAFLLATALLGTTLSVVSVNPATTAFRSRLPSHTLTQLTSHRGPGAFPVPTLPYFADKVSSLCSSSRLSKLADLLYGRSATP